LCDRQTDRQTDRRTDHVTVTFVALAGLADAFSDIVKKVKVHYLFARRQTVQCEATCNDTRIYVSKSKRHLFLPLTLQRLTTQLCTHSAVRLPVIEPCGTGSAAAGTDEFMSSRRPLLNIGRISLCTA